MSQPSRVGTLALPTRQMGLKVYGSQFKCMAMCTHTPGRPLALLRQGPVTNRIKPEEPPDMQRTKQFHLGTAAAIGFAALFAIPTPGIAQAPAPAAVAIDNDDIGGVVRGPSGPEAGVWVIAETNDLPTRFARSVVTDDLGRYVVPDLPKAKYKVW